MSGKFGDSFFGLSKLLWVEKLHGEVARVGCEVMKGERVV